MEPPRRRKRTDVRGGWKAALLGRSASILLKGWTATLRVEVDDRSGVTQEPPPQNPRIFLLWHNRLLCLPTVWWRIAGKQRKAVALASASKDGGAVAAALEPLGIRTVRGSSSRRGATALLGLKQALATGHDACLTPDGPKGPRHKVQPGVVTLARLTGVPVVPIHLVCRHAWRLPTWDRLLVPVPFSKVRVVIGEGLVIAQDPAHDDAEVQRIRIENAMLAITEDA